LLLELIQGGELRNLIHPNDKEMRSMQISELRKGGLAGMPHQPAKFYIAAIALPLIYLHRF